MEDEKYNPPFEITNEIITLIGDISRELGKISSVKSLSKLPYLRKANRIRSLHSSLVIEGNSLTIDETKAVLGGKKVIAPKEDIIAVQNAYEAYRLAEKATDLFDINNLLAAHGIMMKNLLENAGKFRGNAIGVFNKDIPVHIAPPAKNVPGLIFDLFKWTKTTDIHPLIKYAVFHYEFEYIHPFSDGNGRMGRLWHTQLLAKHDDIFSYMPIETIIHERQQEYYNAFMLSNSEGKSTQFILFILKAILDAVKQAQSEIDRGTKNINYSVYSLLEVMGEEPLSLQQLMLKMKMKSRAAFKRNYLAPALHAGLIQMTHPNTPTSKLQKYYKT